MRKTAIQGIFLGFSLFFFSGCGVFVEDTYSAVTPHSVAVVSDGTGVVAVENYHELVNAMLHFVQEHQDQGQIRLTNYEKETARAQLAQAEQEVLTSTAMGSFGVESIDWELNSIMSNLEATVTVEYSKTLEEYENIQQLNGSTAIASSIALSLEQFSESMVVQNSWASNDRGQITTLIQRAMAEMVGSLVEIPEIHVFFYPKEGAWRILELQFTYEESTETLVAQQKELREELSDLTGSLWSHFSGETHLLLLQWLSERAELAEDGNTPYDILVKGKGDSQGFALTYYALCQEMGLDCQVVNGTFQGKNHVWNLITLEQGEIHFVDLSQAPAEDQGFVYYGSDSLRALGYQWDSQVYGEAQEPEIAENQPA